MKHVNVERGIPSAELRPGETYRLVLPHRILSVVNVMKIISLDHPKGTVTLMEAPFSKIQCTAKTKDIIFLERIGVAL